MSLFFSNAIIVAHAAEGIHPTAATSIIRGCPAMHEGKQVERHGPEICLRKALRDAGLSGYRVQWGKVPGNPDIAYPGRKIAIFVHGCFWHRCSKCKPKMPEKNQDYWEAKFKANQERDRRVLEELEDKGWIAIVVWECKISFDVQSVVEVIRGLLAANETPRIIQLKKEKGYYVDCRWGGEL